MAVPCVVAVSYSDTNPTDILKGCKSGYDGKGILEKDSLPETIEVYHDVETVQVYPWKIDTKYYTADVHLCTVKDDKFGTADILENMQALVIHFDNSNKESFIRVEMLMSLIKGYEPDVRLLVCDNYSQENVSIPKLAAQEWCLQNMFELVELYPEEVSDPEDDFADTTGMKRIIQALHAHTWSNLVMKEKPAFLLPDLENLIKPGFSKPESHSDSSEKITTDMKNINLDQQPFEKPGQCSPESDLLDVFGSEMTTEDQSFEELFEKFQRMKEKAKELPVAERKVYAEKVAIAFWRAMGGDEEEIAGLDEEDE